MSNQSREFILRQRVSQLLTECDKSAAYIEETKSTAKKSLDLLNDIQNEFYSKEFKKTLQKLDEIMFTIIDFNDFMEKKKIYNIFDFIDNYSNNQLTTPVKLENEEIDNIVPTDSIEDKIDEAKIPHSSEEVHNITNINENEIGSPLLDNSVLNKNLSVQKYSKNDEFECIIIHVENPWRIYVVPKEHTNDYHCMLTELNSKYDYSKVGFANKQELLNSKQSCFMYFDNIAETWCRAVINNTLPDQIDCIEVLSVDTGRKFITNIDNLYILNQQLLSCNRYLIEVKLNLVQPLEHSNRQWSKECIEYLQEFEFKKCLIMVEKVLKDSLLVLMSYEKNDLSLDITLKHFAQFYGGDDENIDCDLETSDVIENIQTANNDILFNENIGPDIDIKFDNLHLNDEKILCKFYKGPPDTTCFKGDRCKKIHKVFNKDCWTVERVPIRLIATMDLPKPNSVVKLLVTSVKSCSNIYVQLLSVTNPTECDIDYNNLRNRFQTLTSSMNKQSNISLMKNFEYSPAIGEFVAAKCNKNTWQRAKIISVNKDSVELIFIDYGIYSEIHISNIRKLSPEYFGIPQQAVECIIVNVKEEYQGKVAKARSCISDMILNKSLTAEVKYAQAANGLLEIILLDEHGYDVAGMLHALDLIEIDNSYNDKFQTTDKDSYKVQIIPG